jgi:hypothetical protein
VNGGLVDRCKNKKFVLEDLQKGVGEMDPNHKNTKILDWFAPSSKAYSSTLANPLRISTKLSCKTSKNSFKILLYKHLAKNNSFHKEELSFFTRT